jgi:hypothetical protein
MHDLLQYIKSATRQAGYVIAFTIMSRNHNKLCMLHTPKWRLVAFEWETHKHIMVWNLSQPMYLIRGLNIDNFARLFCPGEQPEDRPRLFSRPWEAPCIIDIIAKHVLPQFTDFSIDDVLHSFLDALATANLVDKLKNKRSG